MDLSTYVARVKEAAAFIGSRIDSPPGVAIVLGTGLDDLMELIEVQERLHYTDIPHFQTSTVVSHAGELVVGNIAGVSILAMRGRMHLYEGYSAAEVTFPMRVLGELGVKNIIISNACGAMNPDYAAGDIVLIEDHINLMGHNPLEGANHDEWGPRFPDMSDPYANELRLVAREAATTCGIKLHEGVYLAVVGPNLETRAEYKMLRLMGADVVGMSTVPETLVANHMSMRVLGFSVVTDECFPDSLEPLSIEDVLASAKKASPALAELLGMIIPQI